MATTATAKGTLGLIFGTIGSTAGAITAAVDTGVEAIDMLDRFVKKAARKQLISDTIEIGVYEKNLLSEMSLDLAARQNEVLEFCQKSSANHDLYTESHSFLTSILEDAKAQKKI